MDALVFISLGVFGAAGVAGGIVLYKGSKGTGHRAFGAASLAAGLSMGAILLMVMPV